MNLDDSRSLARAVVRWGLSKKAEDALLLDVEKLSDVTDCFVLLTGSSPLQVQAIADAVLDGAREGGRKPLHQEGRDLGRWVLIDYVDVVVHVMLPELRRYYGLERLWGDAPQMRFDEEGETLPDEGAPAPEEER